MRLVKINIPRWIGGVKHLKVMVAQTWNELSAVQIQAYCTLIYVKRDSLFSVEKDKEGRDRFKVKDRAEYYKARVAMLYFLLGIDSVYYNRITSVQISSLLEEYKLDNFLFAEINLTKNPLPLLRYKGVSYYGPEEKFAYLQALEFSFADTYYFKWKKTNDISYLVKMIAVLWRPARVKVALNDPEYNADKRQAFNMHNVDGRFAMAGKLSLPKKLAIGLWYEGVRTELPRRFPNAFTEDKQKEADRHGWAAVMLQMSGTKFGTVEQTYKAQIETVLMEMEIMIERNKK